MAGLHSQAARVVFGQSQPAFNMSLQVTDVDIDGLSGRFGTLLSQSQSQDREVAVNNKRTADGQLVADRQQTPLEVALVRYHEKKIFMDFLLNLTADVRRTKIMLQTALVAHMKSVGIRQRIVQADGYRLSADIEVEEKGGVPISVQEKRDALMLLGLDDTEVEQILLLHSKGVPSARTFAYAIQTCNDGQDNVDTAERDRLQRMCDYDVAFNGVSYGNAYNVFVDLVDPEALPSWDDFDELAIKCEKVSALWEKVKEVKNIQCRVIRMHMVPRVVKAAFGSVSTFDKVQATIPYNGGVLSCSVKRVPAMTQAQAAIEYELIKTPRFKERLGQIRAILKSTERRHKLVFNVTRVRQM